MNEVMPFSFEILIVGWTKFGQLGLVLGYFKS